MIRTKCPRCKQETITLKQKILTNKWIDIYCSNCGGRSCANPIILALMSFILTWNFIFFGYLAIQESSVVFATLFFVGWGLIEMFMYYIPLCSLRPKEKPDTPSS